MDDFLKEFREEETIHEKRICPGCDRDITGNCSTACDVCQRRKRKYGSIFARVCRKCEKIVINESQKGDSRSFYCNECEEIKSKETQEICSLAGCGEKISPERIKNRAIYCSTKCRDKAGVASMIVLRNIRRGLPLIPKNPICQNPRCGKEILGLSPRQIRRKKFCDRRCIQINKWCKYKVKDFELRIKPRTCENPNCGKVFDPSSIRKDGKLSNSKCCSRRCSVNFATRVLYYKKKMARESIR